MTAARILVCTLSRQRVCARCCRAMKTTPRGEPEHLRLLLAIAATEMPDDLTARAVARSPGPLLRALDRLQTAGWKFEELALASFAPLVRRFNELMKQCGFVLPVKSIGCVCNKRRRARENFPTFSSPDSTARIGQIGFSFAPRSNWRRTRLLFSIIHRKNSAAPTSCGSVRGKKLSAKRSRSQHRAILAIPFSVKRKCAAIRSPSTSSSARMPQNRPSAIALTALRFLAQRDDARVGIIFAQRGALPRLVSAELTRLGVPHNDGLGTFRARNFRDRGMARVARAASQSAHRFLSRLFQCSDESLRNFSGPARQRNRARLAERTQRSVDRRSRSLARILRRIKMKIVVAAIHSLGQLPARATITEFLRLHRRGLRSIGLDATLDCDRESCRRLDRKNSFGIFPRSLPALALRNCRHFRARTLREWRPSLRAGAVAYCAAGVRAGMVASDFRRLE